MPNHVTNRIVIRSSKSKSGSEILMSLMTEEGGLLNLDFNKVLPMPEEIRNTDSPNRSPDEEKQLLIEKYGADNWYDWSINNWGTKWGAYETEHDEESDTAMFRTAWSAPIHWLIALSNKFPENQIFLEYADEDTGYNTGEAKFLGGRMIEKIEHLGGSKKAYEKAFELCGGGEFYQLNSKTGTYEYAE